MSPILAIDPTAPAGSVRAWLPLRARLSCSSWDRSSDELWVHAELIEQLCSLGHDPRDMQYEAELGPGSRPDLMVVPQDGPVWVFECKLWPPTGTQVRQAVRYARAAWDAFPDREVRVYLIWPHDRFRIRDGAGALRVLDVA